MIYNMLVTTIGKREWGAVIGVLTAAVLVRIPFMWSAGFVDDVSLYAQWTWKAFHFGISTLYDSSHGITSDNYPLCLYPFKLIGHLYNILIGSFDRAAVHDRVRSSRWSRRCDTSAH